MAELTDHGPARLPRGRHGLSREQVQESQRGRIFLAMASAMAEKGYVETSVADVLKRSGVGRESFYQLFTSKLDCFLQAFDVAGQMLVSRLEQAVKNAEGTPIERFEHSFGEYLAVLAEQPELARVFLVEVYAAGPEALERRAEVQEHLVDRMVAVLDARGAQGRFACQVLVAAVSTLVTQPLAAGDTAAIRRLRRKVVDLVRTALTLRDA
ncbi:MAG TPA: TetR/AcrR family transcriptional regulator [Acidimicrobiia bacterium]|nr:TetR/AcrR family transcriptional regulator [Acidimicrobiia bacterium]